MLDIGLVPDLCLSASRRHGLIANLQDEIAFFECPFAVSTNEGEFAGRQLEGDSLHLTRLQIDLREVAQTTVIRHDTGNEV